MGGRVVDIAGGVAYLHGGRFAVLLRRGAMVAFLAVMLFTLGTMDFRGAVTASVIIVLRLWLRHPVAEDPQENHGEDDRRYGVAFVSLFAHARSHRLGYSPRPSEPPTESRVSAE